MPDVAPLIAAQRNLDGGFGPTKGAPSEPEATALAAIALDDAKARDWLANHQHDDGGFLVGPSSVRNDSPTPLAALALAPGASRERALDYVVSHQAQPLGDDPRFPHDPSTRGWGWTSLTFGWVEPTARALLALKVLRPAAREQIADGARVLADRECQGGGWNYGNREVLGRNLEPYLQTTAAATLALQDDHTGLRDRGLNVMERLWATEVGGLGWSLSLAAMRAAGRDHPELADQLSRLAISSDLLGDTVALAWAAIALGPGLQRLKAGG